MAKDIEEFLRMAAARRKQALNQQQAPAPVARSERPPIRQSVKPEIQIHDDGQAVDMRNQSVAAHVSSHIQTSDITQHVKQLGNRVSTAHENVEARVSQHLDHDVGHLNLRPSDGVSSEVTRSTSDDVSQIAEHLVSLLGNPQGIRSAIILNEILKRPDFD